MKKTPIIYLAFANDHQGGNDVFLRELQEEYKGIISALNQAKDDGLCEMIIRIGVTIDEVIQDFQDRRNKDRISVFHFAGHAGEFSLAFEAPFKEKNIVQGKGFMSFLAAQTGLKLVFLNACATQKQAMLLLKEKIPSVIYTDEAIKDSIAREIAVRFYGFLGRGDHLYTAFVKATNLVDAKVDTSKIRALYRHPNTQKHLPWSIDFNWEDENIREWNLQDMLDKPLYALPITEVIELPSEPFPGIKPYSGEMAGVFWGRDQEIKAFYELLRNSQKKVTIIYGAEGVGKSSLLRAGLIPRIPQSQQIIFCENIDLKEVMASLNSSLDAHNISLVKEKIFCIIDDLQEPEPDFLNTILSHTIFSNSCGHLVLCIRTSFFPSWEAALEAKAIIFNSFYLTPITESGIQQVVLGITSTSLLRTHFQASIDEDFPKRIVSLFIHDTYSAIVPNLQYLLKKIWFLAKLKSNSNPRLHWDLYLAFKDQGGWSNFVEKQLRKCDITGYNNGLLLNILHHITSERLISLDNLAMRFPTILHTDNLHLIDQLKKERLLSTPCTDSIAWSKYLVVSHEILTVPVLDLVSLSVRPGQMARRILWNHSEQNTFLSGSDLKILKRAMQAFPSFTEREAKLVRESQRILKRDKAKKQLFNFIRICGIIVIVGTTVVLSNPYLFLLIILVVMLYRP